MVFRNTVKNGIVTRVAPCGFSKSSHKKMVKKKIAKDISLEDLNSITRTCGGDPMTVPHLSVDWLYYPHMRG